MTHEPFSPEQAVAHLQPENWERANRRMIGKAIAEFAHELLIVPELVRLDAPWGQYRLATDRDDVQYAFRAQVLSLEHWYVDLASITRSEGGVSVPLDVMSFILDLRVRLGLSEQQLPGYLQELASTLYGAAYRQWLNKKPAGELVFAGFQELETSMTAGHPSFVANGSRLGFDALDYQRYAPESAHAISLFWLAARKTRTSFGSVAHLSPEALFQQELGAEVIAAFNGTIEARGFDPRDYWFVPVHPWQWHNRLAQLFAADLASGDLIALGAGADRYLAQQSIRTLYNVSEPRKHYVKTALSILNMGFVRGMPAALDQALGPINDWVRELVTGDTYLSRKGFAVLREVAFVGYRHRHYEAASQKRADPYKEMLAALWRESPLALTKPGEQLMTMAALMHLDARGASLLKALIETSGVSTDDWLDAYLGCYFEPLVHCFYAHHLLFTPHCENVILVLQDHVPARAIIKDITEDIGVTNPKQALPESVRRLALRVPEEVMTLGIFTDVFDCVFRYLAQLLYEHLGYAEERFWERVAASIQRYQQAHPELAADFRRYDLFAPSFIRNCLNRLQLTNHQQMIDLNAADPVDSLQFAGALQNPIARWAPGARATTSAEVYHGAA